MIIFKSTIVVKHKLTEFDAELSLGTDNVNYPSMSISDYMVAFSGQTSNYCIGIVDMVNSTNISSRLSVGQLSKYYQIFLNTMASTLSRYGGQVIKNVGDSLLFYFPESVKNRTFGYMACIEGGLGMLAKHDHVCLCAKQEELPCINYRISCDYGPVVIMNTNTENSGIDMIGPPVNMCNKINHFASDNEFVIGGDLFQMVKKLGDYRFSRCGNYNSELKQSYPVYKVSQK